MGVKSSNMILVEGSDKDLSNSVVYPSNVLIFNTDNGTFKKGNGKDKYTVLEEFGGGSGQSYKEGTVKMLEAGSNKEGRVWSAETLKKYLDKK